MIKKIYFLFVPIIFLIGYGCGSKAEEENEQLKIQMVEMMEELEEYRRISVTLREVGSLLDSIEGKRQELGVNLEEGTSYEEYEERINGIKQFIETSSERVANLEKQLEESAATNRVYGGSLSRLRRELDEKNGEIARLMQVVDEVRAENKSLDSTVQIQKAKLEGLEAEVEETQKKVKSLNTELTTVKADSKNKEADAYFNRARAVEETANRTKFNGKKKKASLREALKLYEKAYELGNSAAKAEVERLKEKHFSSL